MISKEIVFFLQVILCLNNENEIMNWFCKTVVAIPYAITACPSCGEDIVIDVGETDNYNSINSHAEGVVSAACPKCGKMIIVSHEGSEGLGEVFTRNRVRPMEDGEDVPAALAFPADSELVELSRKALN